MVKLLKPKISGRLHLANRHWAKDGLLSQGESMFLLTDISLRWRRPALYVWMILTTN